MGKLTKEQEQRAVRELQDLCSDDPESAHLAADEILLVLIDNAEVRAAFKAIDKWYA
jgi:hypothetical protein